VNQLYYAKKPKQKKVKIKKQTKPVYCKYCRFFKTYYIKQSQSEPAYSSQECKQECIDTKDWFGNKTIVLGKLKPSEKNKDNKCFNYKRKWYLFWR
jgi:hypothetical protein